MRHAWYDIRNGTFHQGVSPTIGYLDRSVPWTLIDYVIRLFVWLQDAQTGHGTCPLCRKALAVAQLYSEEDVQTPRWHAERAAKAATAAALAAATGSDAEKEDLEGPWTPSTKLAAAVAQLKDTHACGPYSLNHPGTRA